MACYDGFLTAWDYGTVRLHAVCSTLATRSPTLRPALPLPRSARPDAGNPGTSSPR